MKNPFAEAKHYQAEVARLTGELEAASTATNTATETAAAHLATITDLQGQLGTAQASLTEAQGTVATLQARVAELEGAQAGQAQVIQEKAGELAIEQIASAGVPVIPKLPEGGPVAEGPSNLTEFNAKYAELSGTAAQAYWEKYNGKFFGRKTK